MAEAEARKSPVPVRPSRGGAGRGRGKEKSRDVWKRRAVGEVAALDMAPNRRTSTDEGVKRVTMWMISMVKCVSNCSTFEINADHRMPRREFVGQWQLISALRTTIARLHMGILSIQIKDGKS